MLGIRTFPKSAHTHSALSPGIFVYPGGQGHKDTVTGGVQRQRGGRLSHASIQGHRAGSRVNNWSISDPHSAFYGPMLTESTEYISPAILCGNSGAIPTQKGNRGGDGCKAKSWPDSSHRSARANERAGG